MKIRGGRACACRRVVLFLAVVLLLTTGATAQVGSVMVDPGSSSSGFSWEALWSRFWGWWTSEHGGLTARSGATQGAGDGRGVIDPNGLTGSDAGDGRGVIDPNGLTGSDAGDGRGVIDPNGLTGSDAGDGRGVIDPNGHSSP